MSEFNGRTGESMSLRFDERKLLEQFINEAPKLHKMIVILFLASIGQTAIFFVGAKETNGIFLFMMASSLGVGLSLEAFLSFQNLRLEVMHLMENEKLGVKIKAQYKVPVFKQLYAWRSKRYKAMDVLIGVPLLYLLSYLSSFLVNGNELFAPKGDAFWWLTIFSCIVMTVYSMKVSYRILSMVPGYMENKYKAA